MIKSVADSTRACFSPSCALHRYTSTSHTCPLLPSCIRAHSPFPTHFPQLSTFPPRIRTHSMIHILDMYHTEPRTRKARANALSAGVFPLPSLRGRKQPAPDDLMAQMRKGTMAWIVLATLEKRGELYGHGLRREVFVKSKGLFPIQEGPLYPLLGRMQRAGWVMSRRRSVSGRGRRYYRVSACGRRVLDHYRREWKLLSAVLETLGCPHA